MNHDPRFSSLPGPPRAKYLVAVSGGPDSMALLSLLMENFPNEIGRLRVAHVNYGLRGKDSDRDERLVREFCRAQGVPFRKFRSRALRKGTPGLQDRARAIRYAYFARLARREGAWGVVVAHHLEDQAETVLDRFLRGAGIRGLSGLRPLQELDPLGDGRVLRLWRPLLGTRKKELRSFLRSRKIPWRKDGSNQGDEYRRNRIRHRLLPYLTRWRPGITASLARMGSLLAAEDALLEDLAAAHEGRGLVRRGKNAWIFHEAAFRRIPLALQRRLVRRAAQKLEPRARGLGFEAVEGILGVWEGRVGGPRDVGYGFQAGRRQGLFVLKRGGKTPG